MNGWRGYSVRVEGAKYGVSVGSGLAMAIPYKSGQFEVLLRFSGPEEPFFEKT